MQKRHVMTMNTVGSERSATVLEIGRDVAYHSEGSSLRRRSGSRRTQLAR